MALAIVIVTALGLYTISAFKTLARDYQKAASERDSYIQTTKDLRRDVDTYEQIILEKAKESEDLRKQNETLQQENEKLKREVQAKAASRIKLAKSSAPASPTATIGSCDAYRPLVAQYNWPVEAALKVMKAESGCNPFAQSKTNDHGLFQLHGQAIYDPAQNIAIAYAKYVGGRVGANNFSAWYAVCTPGSNPQPKYAGIPCS